MWNGGGKKRNDGGVEERGGGLKMQKVGGDEWGVNVRGRRIDED